MKKQTLLMSVLIICLLTTLSSWASKCQLSEEYDFSSGIIYGLVIAFALLCKIFGADVGIYAKNNSEFLYWLGFIIGIGAFGGDGSAVSRR